MIEATLPLPPSANNLFVNLKKGGRAKSMAYKDWRRTAGMILLAAYSKAGKPQWDDKAPMHISLRLGINYQRDPSNCIKPIEDLICATLPVPDDRYNDRGDWQRDLTIEGFVKVRLFPTGRTI